MKKIFFIKKSVICFFIASLAFVFSSCEDDELGNIYFKCQLNGEKYKTYPSGISFETKTEPSFAIKTIGEYNMTYSFYTTISPEDLSDDYFTYSLSFTLYRKEPLIIGETYFIHKRSDEENSTYALEIKPILKDYIYISAMGDNGTYFGSGTIQLIEYNEKENCYTGIVEFEFDLPIEIGGRNKKSILKGKFRAIDY